MQTRLRRLVGASAVLTGLLMVLGVYTAAAGAGLTCEARWPLCDGAVFGLFPANWGSFVEWFHRLVAMVTGLLILGTTVQVRRRGADGRVFGALAVATLLLPAQILLGALTVTRYELLILTAHYVTASAIFVAVAAAAAWAYERTDTRALRGALVATAVSLPPFVGFSPRVLVPFGPTVQAAYYTLGLGALGTLVALALWSHRAVREAGPGSGSGTRTVGRVRAVAAVAAGTLFCLLVFGRQAYATDVLGLVGGLAVVGLVGVAGYLLFVRAEGAPEGPDATLASGGD
jgi:cytochrome c oxidase assembly protein subunit 15